MSQLDALMNADATAFLATPSAPLQSEPEPVQGAVASPEPDALSQLIQPEEAQPQLTEEAVSGQPVPQEPVEEEFDIDLDKDPTAPPESTPATTAVAAVEPSSKDELDAEMGKFLALPRGKVIYSAHKTLTALARPDEEGGIGHKPSADQVRDYFRAFADMQAVNNEFNSGTPEGVAQWANRWFPREAGAVAEQTAGTLVDVLAQQNPQAYNAVRSQVAQREFIPVIEDLIDRANASTDEGQTKVLYEAAQIAHKRLYGNYFHPEIMDQRRNPQQPVQPHPAEVELARIRAQEQQRQQAYAQQATSAISSEIHTAMEAALSADADTALAAIRGNVPEVIYRGIKKDLLDAVRQDVGRNREALNLLQQRQQAAIRQGAKQEIPNLVRQYRQLTFESLKARRVEYLNAAGQTAKTHSDQRHAQLQQASSRTAPQATQVPVARDINPAITRQPGETHESYMGRMMMADMNRVQAAS